MRLILLFFTVFTMHTYGHHPDLQAYRKLLDRSVENKQAANEFYAQLKTVKENAEPSLLGFKAMSEFMLCKHLINPMSRLSHFNKGRNLLEKAIKLMPKDPELLFFRLSTQSNIPSILGYNANINADKLALLDYLKNETPSSLEDKALHKRIKSYLLINQYCKVEEKEMIKAL